MSAAMRPERGTLAKAIDTAFNRRRFVAAAGALATSALVPLEGVAIAQGSTRRDLLDDWSIDDMWGVYPRYSDAIGYAGLSGPPVHAVDPADTDWCC